MVNTDTRQFGVYVLQQIFPVLFRDAGSPVDVSKSLGYLSTQIPNLNLTELRSGKGAGNLSWDVLSERIIEYYANQYDPKTLRAAV